MNAMNEAISKIGIVPVIKLSNPERDAVPLAKALCAGGVPVAEITCRAAGADRAIRLIREAVPDVVERISWSMPTYWRGRNLLQFSASKKHLGFYPGKEAVQAFAGRLQQEGWDASRGTIRLPYDRPFPEELVKDVARWCRERYGK